MNFSKTNQITGIEFLSSSITVQEFFFTKTIALTEMIGLTFIPGQIEVEILCCGGKKGRVNTDL